MLTFLTYFVLVINGNRINRFHLFWDTLYIAAICVNCCNLRILQKTFKSPFNCHGDMLTKTVSVALSLIP